MIGLPRKVGYSFPIDFVEIEPNPNPTSRTKISRDEKRLSIVSDQAALLVEARLAAKRNHAVAVMIEKKIGKILFSFSVARFSVTMACCIFVKEPEKYSPTVK